MFNNKKNAQHYTLKSQILPGGEPFLLRGCPTASIEGIGISGAVPNIGAEASR